MTAAKSRRPAVSDQVVTDLDVSRHPLHMSTALVMKLASAGHGCDQARWTAADAILAKAIRHDEHARAIYDTIIANHKKEIGKAFIGAAFSRLRDDLAFRLIELGHSDLVELRYVQHNFAIAA